MGKLLPVIIAVIGLVIGAGAGFMLKPSPPPTEEAAHEGDAHATDAHGAQKDDGHGKDTHDGGDGTEFVKLNNQFVIPVVHQGKVASLVVLSISLEVDAGGEGAVFQKEPKLRDALLQVLFDHANSGGFDGAFTETENMTHLRRAIFETAQHILGPMVHGVLLTDIVRQDT